MRVYEEKVASQFGPICASQATHWCHVCTALSHGGLHRMAESDNRRNHGEVFIFRKRRAVDNPSPTGRSWTTVIGSLWLRLDRDSLLHSRPNHSCGGECGSRKCLFHRRPRSSPRLNLSFRQSLVRSDRAGAATLINFASCPRGRVSVLPPKENISSGNIPIHPLAINHSHTTISGLESE